MALLFHDEEVAKKNQKIYVDRKYFSRYEDQVAALRDSKWVYIGNLSFHTTEAQVQALFERVGPVQRVIMGLNSKTKTPCGFGFVQFFEAADALESVALVSGTVLDDRQIRVELDFGFKNGRHFGRGQTGGQVRDDRKGTFDPGRSWAAGSGGADRDRNRPGDEKYGGDRGAGRGAGDAGEGPASGGGEKRGRGRRDYDEQDGGDSDKAEGMGADKDASSPPRRGRSGSQEGRGRSDDEDEEGARGKRRRRANSDEDEDDGNKGGATEATGEEE